MFAITVQNQSVEFVCPVRFTGVERDQNMRSHYSHVKFSYISLLSNEAKIDYLQNKFLSFADTNFSFLDAGCGANSRLISNQRGKRFTGCDIDKISILKNKCVSNKVLCFLENLPFHPNSFHIISSYDVIEHIQYPERFISEADRVLKMGGTIFFIVPNLYSIYGLLAVTIPYKIKVLLLKVFGLETKNHVHYYRLNSSKKIARFLLDNNFVSVNVTFLNVLPSSRALRRFGLLYYKICGSKLFSKFSPSILVIAHKK